MPGDWCKLVEEDFNTMNLHMSDELIAQMSEGDYKKLVKTKIRETALNYLQTLQEGHTKVKDNIYTGLTKPTPYLVNRNISYRQASILFALRSKTLRGIKSNFKNMYSNNTLCPLCERTEDTQSHLLSCKVLQDILPMTENTEYSHMNGTAHQQTDFIKIYEKYLKLRDELLEDTSEDSSLPGLYTGPVHPQASNPTGAVRRSDDVSASD